MKKHLPYVLLLVAACISVLFVCICSYGLNFVEYYITGILVSLILYIWREFSPNERKVSYICLALVILSCIYAIPFSIYFAYTAIILGIGTNVLHIVNKKK